MQYECYGQWFLKIESTAVQQCKTAWENGTACSYHCGGVASSSSSRHVPAKAHVGDAAGITGPGQVLSHSQQWRNI